MKISEKPCKNHEESGLKQYSYAGASIEADRRFKVGWRQRLCRRCYRVYVWMYPKQARIDREKKDIDTLKKATKILKQIHKANKEDLKKNPPRGLRTE